MSLLRTNIIKLFQVYNIIIDDFINVKTDFEINSDKYIIKQNSIKFEDLNNISSNKFIDEVKKNINKDSFIHKKVLSKATNKLKNEIYSETYFERGFENWNLTNLVRKYNIQGKEIFLAITENNEKYEKYWENKTIMNNYKYFDYCGIYGIKNGFPIDIYRDDTKLNLRRYVDRSGDKGYYKLIDLLEKKILLKPNKYDLDKKSSNKEKLLEKNELDKNSSNIIIPSMNLEDKNIDYCNHNLIKLEFDSEFKYFLELDENKEIYDMIKEGKKNKIFNLDKYFKYVIRETYSYEENKNIDLNNLENYVLTPRDNISMEYMSVVNCIIFGESNIRFMDVEKLLSLIRFEIGYSSYTLDNFIINYYIGRNITPNIDSEKINKMEFCKYQDMLECAKWLIQIMNEINPNEINKHNYHILVQYCKLKDNHEERTFNYMTKLEKNRINTKTF